MRECLVIFWGFDALGIHLTRSGDAAGTLCARTTMYLTGIVLSPPFQGQGCFILNLKIKGMSVGSVGRVGSVGCFY